MAVSCCWRIIHQCASPARLLNLAVECIDLTLECRPFEQGLCVLSVHLVHLGQDLHRARAGNRHHLLRTQPARRASSVHLVGRMPPKVLTKFSRQNS